jgi:hypothetical protein
MHLISLPIIKEDVLKERQSGYAIWTVVEKEEVRTGRVDNPCESSVYSPTSRK